jgi:hypothetical protein
MQEERLRLEAIAERRRLAHERLLQDRAQFAAETVARPSSSASLNGTDGWLKPGTRRVSLFVGEPREKKASAEIPNLIATIVMETVTGVTNSVAVADDAGHGEVSLPISAIDPTIVSNLETEPAVSTMTSQGPRIPSPAVPLNCVDESQLDESCLVQQASDLHALPGSDHRPVALVVEDVPVAPPDVDTPLDLREAASMERRHDVASDASGLPASDALVFPSIAVTSGLTAEATACASVGAILSSDLTAIPLDSSRPPAVVNRGSPTGNEGEQAPPPASCADVPNPSTATISVNPLERRASSASQPCAGTAISLYPVSGETESRGGFSQHGIAPEGGLCVSGSGLCGEERGMATGETGTLPLARISAAQSDDNGDSAPQSSARAIAAPNYTSDSNESQLEGAPPPVTDSGTALPSDTCTVAENVLSGSVAAEALSQRIDNDSPGTATNESGTAARPSSDAVLSECQASVEPPNNDRGAHNDMSEEISSDAHPTMTVGADLRMIPQERGSDSSHEVFVKCSPAVRPRQPYSPEDWPAPPPLSPRQPDSLSSSRFAGLSAIQLALQLQVQQDSRIGGAAAVSVAPSPPSKQRPSPAAARSPRAASLQHASGVVAAAAPGSSRAQAAVGRRRPQDPMSPHKEARILPLLAPPVSTQRLSAAAVPASPRAILVGGIGLGLPLPTV